jgi:molybdopterin-guanine dinucleotide biosynthesis protein B
MKYIHIVGRQNHGKTTLLVELIEELSRRGVRAGTIKHTSHVHELDTPGKDSFRHRRAGANPVAIVSKDLIGVYLPRDPQADFYDCLSGMFSGCDLVLVEGHLDGPGAKIEVWRQSIGGVPLAGERRDIVAVVSDDPVSVDVPVWPRSDVAAVADQVVALSKR